MNVRIKDRDEYVDYASNHYCKNCAHKDDCNWFYLCPPLEERWDEEEKLKKMFADEEE